MVSHGHHSDDLHRVCIVDADGKLKKSFGQKFGSNIALMKMPFYMSVDKNGFVLVVDRGNGRGLILNSDLKLKRVILSSKGNHEVLYLGRILLDQERGRLLVADNKWNFEKKMFTDGRILVYDFK